MTNWVEKVSSVAIDRMPKKISPGTHALIDYGLAAATAVFALLCWKRNKAAAAAAMMAAMAEVTNIAITDIPGGVCKEISFPLHGRIDMGLTAMLTAMPKFMGFGDEPERLFFYSSALATGIVTSMTDYTGTGELAQSQSLLEARE